MTKKEQTEFEKKVLEQFMSGKNLFGEGGAFAPILKNVIEKALEAEMDGHLDEGGRAKGNKRNGKKKKTCRLVYSNNTHWAGALVESTALAKRNIKLD
ncbi:hypothetical protein [Zobellia uliginosa]|uniref:hypothetical protein n=1 Tax=Zobellia uliginosa TaxID=143224 RepID=UPI0026E21830|nr:hypothetical protein [Zobellia uliginosa]MDO6519040.1 hypothetical protein [Zobellia uliginosa]